MSAQHSAGKPSQAEEVSRLTARHAAGRCNIREGNRKAHIIAVHTVSVCSLYRKYLIYPAQQNSGLPSVFNTSVTKGFEFQLPSWTGWEGLYLW